MTAATGPRCLGTQDSSPRQFTPLPAAGTIYQGWLLGQFPVGTANAGYVAPIGYDPQLRCVGVARFTPSTGTDVYCDPGIVPLFCTGADDTWEGQPAYGVDNQTFQLTDGGGIYPLIGIVWSFETSTMMWVKVGPEGMAEAKAVLAAGAASNAGIARGVFTNLGGTATYAASVLTGPAGTALPTQDGVTPAVGDVWFALKGLSGLPAAAQAGPWEITGLGSASAPWTAERPPWYQTAAVIPTEYTVKVGPEGASLGNSRWTATCTPGGTVDTTDPAFVYEGGPLVAGGTPTSQAARGVVTANVSSLSSFTVAATDLTFAAGDVVLLVGQTTKSQNGPYVVGTVATGTAPLTRTAWWETGAKAPPGFEFRVSEGTQGANSRWLVRTPGPITVDTTAIDIDMIGGNWVQGVSTAVGTMSAPSTFYFLGATLKARLSGIFEVHLDLAWSGDTSADSVTFAFVTDTVTDGSGAVLASANKVNHGTTGLGTFGTRGADWESCDTNAGAAITFNAAAFSTAPVTQASEVAATLTGLLTTNGNGTQKFGFHGIVDNATPTGTTKTPFTVGNQVAFGVSCSASHVITVKSARLTVRELPNQ